MNRLRKIVGVGLLLSLIVAGVWLLAKPTGITAESVFRQDAVLQTAGPAGYKRVTANTDLNLETIVYDPVPAKEVNVSELPTREYFANNEYDRWVRGEIDLGEAHSLISEAEAAALQAAAMELSPDPNVQHIQGGPGLNSPIVGVTFPSLDIDDCCGGGQLTPPDPDLSVGHDHVIAVVNNSFGIYDKAGNLLVGPTTFSTLFGPLGGSCVSFPFDPNALYDEEAGRYIMAADGDGDYYCVAVSQTDSAVGSWYLYAFQTNVGGAFFDYPHAGVGRDAIYMGANMFGAGTGRVWAFDKWAMYAGLPAAAVTQPTGTDDTPQPVKLHGFDQGTWPTEGPHYIMTHRSGANTYAMYAWNDPFGANSLSVVGVYNLQSFHGVAVGYPVSNLQLGGSPYQANDNRALDFEYRNGSGWMTGVASCNPGTGTVNCVQWAEIDLATQTVVQAGVFSSNGDYRSFPDIAANHCGDAAVGYTKSNTGIYPSVFATGRESGDPLGTMQPEVQIKAGEQRYIGYDGSPYRWGDYTGMSVDPDGVTFWYLGEYSKQDVVNQSANWGTYVGSLTFAGCSVAPDFNLTATPEVRNVCIPNNTNYAIDVESLSGYMDAVTLSAAGVPAGYNAGFSPNPVIPGNSASMVLVGSGAASPGSYSIEVTGTAPTSTHSINVDLNLYNSAPGAPTLVSPIGVDQPLVPTFEWSGTGLTYLIVVKNLTSGALQYAVTPDTSYTFATPLDPLTIYAWSVRAYNPCGAGSFAQFGFFRTQDIPPILVVDDDDNAPDVRGTYTAVLDGLGLGYDVWDTANSDNEPDAATLQQYDVVIWFTGDEFGGAAGPGAAGESALATYLNAGGCFLISSQDYVWDRGVTAFMQSHLGIASATSDVSQTTVTGANVYAGLGPYTLAYPFTNYSDRLTPAAGAATGFNGNQGSAAVVSGTHQAVFFGYPFEALPAAGRTPVLQATLSWCSQ
ncbi:MAG: hypothetical protein Fur0021_22470 [Candidatus Promineifilaceae bacterium]